VILMTLLVVGVLGFLWTKLFLYQRDLDAGEAASENAVPTVSKEECEEAAQNCFEETLAGMTMEDWVNNWYEAHPEHFDKQEDVENFLNERIINVGYECFKPVGYSVVSPEYLLMKDDAEIARFALTGSELNWTVDSVKIIPEGDQSFEVTIPDFCRLMINGAEVPAEYASGEKSIISVSDYDEVLINPVSFDKYTVNGLVAEIDEATDVTVIDENGNECIRAVDGEYLPICNDEGTAEYQQKADAFVSALLSYYSKGKENAEGNMAGVLSHVASGSAAAKIINNSLQGVIWRVADYSVAYGTTPSDVYKLADNCYCVDIAYETVSESTTYETGNGVYRVYFVDEGNGFRITQFAGIQ